MQSVWYWSAYTRRARMMSIKLVTYQSGDPIDGTGNYNKKDDTSPDWLGVECHNAAQISNAPLSMS